MTDEVWLEQVRQAIEKIAMNKPEAQLTDIDSLLNV